MLRMSTSLPTLARQATPTRMGSSQACESPIVAKKIGRQAHGEFAYTRKFEDAYESFARHRNLAKLDALFWATDVDDSGEITLAEFQETLRKTPTRTLFANLGIQPHQATAVFRAFDANHDSTISHKEFLEGLKRLVGPDLEGCAADLDAEVLRAANFGKQAAPLGEIPCWMRQEFPGSDGHLLPEVLPVRPAHESRTFVFSARSQALHPATAAPRRLRKTHPFLP
mmetsp:Transcript_79189/g.155409  ORF Transcript_79189/g.155409 Transcript_79189/m.155409 type:complete len:226 (-) Transcript_79189:113-790(-)